MYPVPLAFALVLSPETFSIIVGSLSYKVSIGNKTPQTTLGVEVTDKDGKTVATSLGEVGILTVNNPHLWWPYTMNATDFGYLYTLKVQ
jgi:beta-galactosidase/beta-glucuronidase